MSLANFVNILGVVLLMATGQILFKLAALKLGRTSGLPEVLLGLATNPYFLIAGLIYVSTTVLWVVVLQTVDLSRAYPFMALAIVGVPIVSIFLFGEPFDWRLVVGLILVASGILVLST